MSILTGISVLSFHSPQLLILINFFKHFKVSCPGSDPRSRLHAGQATGGSDQGNQASFNL